MCLMPRSADGYYDDNGEWQRTKYCFVSCGAQCTCGPPGGIWYSAVHDRRLAGTSAGGAIGPEGSGCAVGVSAPNAVHVPVEATDETPEGAGGAVSEIEQ
jgi:hypothetical protein